MEQEKGTQTITVVVMCGFTLVAAATTMTHCSLLGLDGFSAGNGTATDASSTLDGNDLDSSKDASSTNGGLITNGNFEAQDRPRCGDTWEPERASLARGSSPHGGASSCLMCENSTLEGGGIDIYMRSTPPILVPPDHATTYHAEGWVRLVSGDISEVDIRFEYFFKPGEGENNIHQSEGAVALPEWQKISIDFTPAPGIVKMEFAVHAQTDKNACLEVDDLVVDVSP